jgi:hypothetical protein
LIWFFYQKQFEIGYAFGVAHSFCAAAASTTEIRR